MKLESIISVCTMNLHSSDDISCTLFFFFASFLFITALEFKHALSTAESGESSLNTICELRALSIPGPLDIFRRDVLKLPGASQLKHVLDGVLLELGILVTPFAHPETIKCKVLENQKTRRQCDGLLGHGSVCDEVRTRGQNLGQCGGILASNAVKSQTNRLLTFMGKFLDRVLELSREQFGFGDHSGSAKVEKLLFHRISFLGGLSVTNHVKGLDSPLSRKLDSSSTNTAVGTVLDEPFLPSAQPIPFTEVFNHPVSGDGVNANSSNLERRQAFLVLNFDQLRLVQLGVRPPGALICALHDHPVTFVEVVDARPGRNDLKGAFISGHGGGLPGAQAGFESRFARVDALNLVDVGRVQRGREETEVDLCTVGRRDGMLVKSGEKIPISIGNCMAIDASAKLWQLRGIPGHVLEDILRLAVFRVHQRLGLRVAIYRDISSCF